MATDHGKIENFDANSNEFQLQTLAYALSVDLNVLKKWVDAQLANGNKSFVMELSWGYYDDLDDVSLCASKEEPYYHL